MQTCRLNPLTEARFLDSLMALFSAQTKGATGEQLAVIAHYQAPIEKRRAELQRMQTRRGRRVMQ